MKVVEPEPKLTLRQRFINTLIGPPDHMTTQTAEEAAVNHETHDQRLKFLKQTPFMYKVLNINAIIVMTVCVFLYGFFY